MNCYNKKGVIMQLQLQTTNLVKSVVTTNIQTSPQNEPITKKVTPVIKWAGGKTQLLNQIEERLPKSMPRKYVEPFIGGGAVFIHMLQRYEFDKVLLSDRNPALVALYNNIKFQPDVLTNGLLEIQNQYNNLESDEEKKSFFENIKLLYNTESRETLDGSIRFIFLNKTCFNGLYRENKKGLYNVAWGKKDTINLFDAENITNLHRLLSKRDSCGNYVVEIKCLDYSQAFSYADGDTFMYMDPPYRPVTLAGFTSYQGCGFNDDDQRQLADCVKLASRYGSKIMLSNSDPRNAKYTVDEDFFDNLYSEFKIDRVSARRNINCKGSDRKGATEILVMNY